MGKDCIHFNALEIRHARQSLVLCTDRQELRMMSERDSHAALN